MRLYLILALFILSSALQAQTKYFVATNGNDSNPGTITQPFATWEKGGSVLTAGDTLYIRGGTYTNTRATIYQCLWDTLTGTQNDTIKIWAYPGEKPVWDFINMPNLSGSGVYQSFGIEMNECDYVWIKGLTVRRFMQQNYSGSFMLGWNIINSSHVVIEQCTVDSIGGHGFLVAYDAYEQAITNTDTTDQVLFLNCDAISCADNYSTSIYENANGFAFDWNPNSPRHNNEYMTNITLRGCRAYFNSDDGIEFFGVDSYPLRVENCWSFYNGYVDSLLTPYPLGPDANGFKLGPNYNDLLTVHTGTIVNCISAGNTGFGFLQNDHENSSSSLWRYYNNLAYLNGDIGFMAGYWAQIAYVFRNNASYKNITTNNYLWDQVGGYIIGWDSGNYNVWDAEGDGWNTSFTQTDADYQSLDISQLLRPRKANGDLPDVTFGHLVEGSDMIDAGVDVGYPFDGTDPDIGVYFDYIGGSSPPVIPPSSTGGFIKSGNKFIKHNGKFIK